MTETQEAKSFLGRQWEAYKLLDDVARNKSLLNDFTEFDPINGPIIKATQSTRDKAHYGSGIVVFGALWSYGWKRRTRFANDVVGLVALISIPPLVARLVLDFGISSYLLREKDQRAAYVKFNEWLQKRA